MAARRRLATAVALLAPLVTAQFPPIPDGITSLDVQQYPGVSISYKPTSICDTTVKAFSGYVHMPISYLQDIEGLDPYNVSMFFWYFEARNNPEAAPTTIWLAGGPGDSSMFGVALDSGPCYVEKDANSTRPNPWSLNDRVNMLYIDQPVTTGFSYNSLVKSTLDLLFTSSTTAYQGIRAFDDWNSTVPDANTTFLHGMLPAQNPLQTANTTSVAAVTLWHFSQAWFGAFPEWKTCDKRVSIWGNSYGGYWVSRFAAYTHSQNQRIQAGTINGTAVDLDSVGLTNAQIDALYQTPYVFGYPYNNTYDLQVINKTLYEELSGLWTAPKKGCRDLLLECRAAASKVDPQEFANDAKVNALCNEASVACSPILLSATGDRRSPTDMAHLLPDGTPPYQLKGYFNREWVQKDLGVPVNFTGNSNINSFAVLYSGGDIIRVEGMKDIEYLLDSGVKVSLVYGDRDMTCPWPGGERISLQANWTGAKDFRAAGYEYIQTNTHHRGGVVRQHGKLSFSRVFEAGHDVSWYQPETVHQIFNRVLFNTDVATGKVPTSGAAGRALGGNNCTTTGPSSSWSIKNRLPPPPPVDCSLWNAAMTCTSDQFEALAKGVAVIDDGFKVVKPAGGGRPLEK